MDVSKTQPAEKGFDMGKCVNHPDTETSYMCSKHGTYQCEECLECRDPDIYCKFRSACPIWYEHKRKARKARQTSELNVSPAV
jgi:dTDP-4-dehydrorhamnose 3,5-epimerase-like enzyme